MELIRDILLQLEEKPFELGWHDIEIESYTEEEISYHVMLLHEAGLIEAINLSSDDGMEWKAKYLTWFGHEFLDASRDNTRWRKAITIVKEKGGGLAFDILKEVLIQLMKTSVFGN